MVDGLIISNIPKTKEDIGSKNAQISHTSPQVQNMYDFLLYLTLPWVIWFFLYFKTSWKHGLVVHKGKKHKAIKQLDGNITLELEADDEDVPYQNIKSYWHIKVLGGSFLNYIDASKIIEEIPGDELHLFNIVPKSSTHKTALNSPV